MKNSYNKILTDFPALEQNRPLAPLTTFGIGGPADLFYKLTNIDDLEPLMGAAFIEGIPTFILGGGSNTIFADEGFRGLVIQMAAKKITLEHGETALKAATTQIVSAESGALLSQVIQFALKNGLSGMEKMMGLPGTIGGAVRGNAGAFGTEIADLVHYVLLHDPQGTEFFDEASNQQLQFGYRTSAIKRTPDKIVLKVWLKLAKITPEKAQKALAEATDIVKNRISKQPKGKCSGSFFKNPTTPDYRNPQPPESKAGHLLEQIGAKGMSRGGVQVSPQHANWLMNNGTAAHPATQKDVLALSEALQKAVQDRFQITLEREVQLVSAEGELL